MDETEFWAGVVRYLVRYGGPFVPAVFERAKGSYVYDSAGHGQPMRMTEYVSRA
jgi:2,2-dialkylglycine decarboxylase (pyruvate)